MTAQHDGIVRLREQAATLGNVRRLHRGPPRNGAVRIVQLNLTPIDVPEHGEGARRHGLPCSPAGPN
ncbi:hypothetical protein ACFXBB_31565 [Streptomyces scopuliridis]|uniref:hypothetical protein n=1 Tax=Streptomyces scopuliridis TaxID=452529 RepID=UPI00367823D1